MHTGDNNSVSLDEVTPSGGYLALFNQHIQKGKKTVEWKFSDGHEQEEGGEVMSAAQIKKTTPVWCAIVFVDDEAYGRGKGTTKQMAKNEAAKEGLDRMGVTVV